MVAVGPKDEEGGEGEDVNVCHCLVMVTDRQADQRILIHYVLLLLRSEIQRAVKSLTLEGKPK